MPSEYHDVTRYSDGTSRGSLRCCGRMGFPMFHTGDNGVNLKGQSFIGCLRNKQRQGLGDGTADHHGGQAEIREKMNARRIGCYSKAFQQAAEQAELFLTEYLIAFR